jgi:hypothetical protein
MIKKLILYGWQKRKLLFLDFQGKCLLPNYQEVKNADVSSKPFMLILDNNVCIHISEIDGSNSDKIKKTKINNFLKYCETSNITILPAFGLLERASTPGTLELNKDRLIYSENIFWQKLDRYKNNDMLPNKTSTIEPLKAFLYPFYAYLLMIKLILIRREPSQANIERNFKDLYDFISRIGIYLALPWQFALAVFGGETKLNKFIRPKKGDVLKSLWAASWDLFYIQQIHQFNGIREINKGVFPRFILVTDDEACATIADFTKIHSAFDYGSTIYNVAAMNANFPHLNGDLSFLHEINSNLNTVVHQRAYTRSLMSELDQQNDIVNTVDKAYSFILELTEQVKNHEKKGFG